MLDHISFSSMRQYIDCGLQLRFRKIDCLEPEFVSDALVFGSCIHKALATFNQHRKENKSVNSNELGDWFEEYWQNNVPENIKYNNGNNYNSAIVQGRNLLSTFYEQKRDDYQILEIEKEFRLDLKNLPLSIIGYIDLIETDESGNILITEFKTAARSYSRSQIDQNEQLTVYHLAMQDMYPEKRIINKIECLIKTKTLKLETYYSYRDIDDHNRFIKTAQEVVKGIQAEVFIPNINSWKCGNCEFKTACREYLKS